MTPHDLIAEFEAVADAPDGVVRLRELVLELAVRGRLAPQDSADEPAIEGVRRARAEQVGLASSKAIPAPLPTTEIKAEDAPHEVPGSWVWAPLGHVVAVLDFMRRPIKGKEREARTFGKPQSALYPYYGATQQVGWIDEYIFDEELVLLGEDGAPFFKPGKGVAYVVSGRYWVNNHAHALRGLGILNSYLSFVLNQTSYDGFVSGTTRPKLTQGKMVQLPVPVPPLAEQHRIVARVDALMGLLDKLETARAARDTTRAAVRDSSLAELCEADAPDEVEVAWNRFAERLDDLLIDPADVAPLRQTVLELAFGGQLVRSTSGKWPDVALSEVAEDLRNGTSSRGGEGGPPVVVLRLADIKQGQIVPTSFRKIDLSRDSVRKYSVRDGDILAIRVNGSADLVGRLVVVERAAEWCYCDHLIRIRLQANTLDPRFLRMFGDTFKAREHLSSVTVTTAGQKTVNQKGLRSLRVPRPSLAEQRDVVVRVDALMGLLDRLEERLADAQTAHAAFATAAVHHLDT